MDLKKLTKLASIFAKTAEKYNPPSVPLDTNNVETEKQREQLGQAANTNYMISSDISEWANDKVGIQPTPNQANLMQNSQDYLRTSTELNNRVNSYLNNDNVNKKINDIEPYYNSTMQAYNQLIAPPNLDSAWRNREDVRSSDIASNNLDAAMDCLNFIGEYIELMRNVENQNGDANSPPLPEPTG